jgi:hypothetical protein
MVCVELLRNVQCALLAISSHVHGNDVGLDYVDAPAKSPRRPKFEAVGSDLLYALMTGFRICFTRPRICKYCKESNYEVLIRYKTTSACIDTDPARLRDTVEPAISIECVWHME